MCEPFSSASPLQNSAIMVVFQWQNWSKEWWWQGSSGKQWVFISQWCLPHARNVFQAHKDYSLPQSLSFKRQHKGKAWQKGTCSIQSKMTHRMAAKTKGESIASLLFLQVTLHVLLNLTFPNSLCFVCVTECWRRAWLVDRLWWDTIDPQRIQIKSLQSCTSPNRRVMWDKLNARSEGIFITSLI